MKTETLSDHLWAFAGIILDWFIGALVVLVCWNSLFPEWYNLPALTYWRAFALYGVVQTLLYRSK